MTNILTIISDWVYDAHLYSILKEAQENTDKTLYVCLNKTYKSIIEDLEYSKLEKTKFLVIDVITASLITPPVVPDCVFLPDPKNIEQLYSGIVKTVKENQPDLLIFDSLSTLHTHHDCDTVFDTIKDLIAALSLLNCSTVFTALKCDECDKNMNHLKMIFDKIIEVD